MTAEKEIKIRDLEGSKGRLEEAKKLLEAEQHEMSDEIDSHITEAIMDIDDALSKVDDEIRGLGG